VILRKTGDEDKHPGDGEDEDAGKGDLVVYRVWEVDVGEGYENVPCEED